MKDLIVFSMFLTMGIFLSLFIFILGLVTLFNSFLKKNKTSYIACFLNFKNNKNKEKSKG